MHNCEWLRRKVNELLNKHARGTAFELFAVQVLQQLGFTKFERNTRKGYDYDADDKQGAKYAIEVKGTEVGGDVVFKWHGMRSLYGAQGEDRKPMLVFVNAKGSWFVYELLDGFDCG